MFNLDLVRLQREGSLDVTGALAEDDSIWEALDARVTGPVEVRIRATFTAGGQLLVQGEAKGELLRPCRRCLTEVRSPLAESFHLVWVEPGTMGEEEEGEDDELRLLDPSTPEIDIADAIREELLLRMPRWVECRTDCAGLCPHCGVDRNTETCECSAQEGDPRWDALRGLTFDERK